MRETIMIVEDESDIRELVRFTLQREGFNIIGAGSAEEALELLKRKGPTPDIFLLDLLLPGIDGYELCRRIRADKTHAATPVVMLTARDEDADIVAGLEVGADDYITKPFSPRVLTARVKAVLRRATAEPSDTEDILTHGPIQIDRLRHKVKVNDVPIILTPSEFKALDLFMRRPGIVFSRYQIVDAVHGEDYPVTDRSIDVLIVGLRRALGDSGEMIETVRGVGYRIME